MDGITIAVIVTIVIGVVILTYTLIMHIIELGAQNLLEELNKEATQDAYMNALAAWAYYTNLTDENLKNQVAVSTLTAEHQKDRWKRASNVNWKRFSNFSLKRQFKHHATLGYAALSKEKYSKLDEIINKMRKIYSTATICPKDAKSTDNCTLGLEPDLTEILIKSTDPDELKHVWLKYRDAIGPKCRPLYKEYVELANEAARLNDQKDNAASWLDGYEDENFKAKIDTLWNQIRPLYNQLHAYIRTKLREKYGDIVSAGGPIPAHLLGNMWSQDWTSLSSFTMPYPDASEDSDLTEALAKQGYNVLKIYKTAEAFYISINLTSMPETFWSKSVIEKPPNVDMVCHASAWDFYHESDVRIKHCAEVTGKDFVTTHHEMGHIEYFLQYKHQPFPYREGANDGFHEAIGDLIALSVQSLKHKKILGLYSGASNENTFLNNIFLVALRIVAVLPFTYLTDLWRWDVFSGVTKPENYNCRWWELKVSYQGIEPPSERSEQDFDPVAKYHVASDVPYLRYFISIILQYQFQKSLCIVADEYEVNNPDKPLHDCDIYENKKAGTLLKKMLAMGSSQPWPDALEVVTNQREMDASGFLEYFKPLHDWLIKENIKNKAKIGWDRKKKDMEYAVVKFIHETTESDSEVVSEVPTSWLTKNNTYCKWPSEKFASVYIAKKFGPKDDWEEFPIEVEYFCETHAEAKGKLKKKDKEETDVGRGYRKIKPTDYFSPAEEDERMKTKKKLENKDTPDVPKSGESAIKFISMFGQKDSTQTVNINSSPVSPETGIDSDSSNSSINNCLIQTAPTEENNLEGNFITHAVIPENEVKQLVTKIDQLIGMMADVKIDLATIKELMPDLTKKDVGIDDELGKPLPFTDLENLEAYNAELQNNELERKKFLKFLKSIGGHDEKDWTYRLLKSIMTDSVAEACSWTGRKNNYEIRHLKIIDLLYRVVNQKTSCNLKNFENHVAEWLRHAHTRKIRKDKK